MVDAGNPEVGEVQAFFEVERGNVVTPFVHVRRFGPCAGDASRWLTGAGVETLYEGTRLRHTLIYAPLNDGSIRIILPDL